MKVSYGHKLGRSVPACEGTHPKVCGQCQLWFAARPRERTCDGCVPKAVRTKRFAQDRHWGTKAGLKAPRHAGQRASNRTVQDRFAYASESALLGVTFTRPVKIWEGLAMEAAACIDSDGKHRTTGGIHGRNDWQRDPLAPRAA